MWSRCGVVHRSVSLTQRTESEAKTKVNNRDGGGAEEGAFVVELKSSTSWIIMYVVYKETTLQKVRLYYSAVKKNKKNSFDTVFLSIVAE